MAELVERLRAIAENPDQCGTFAADLVVSAADEIERLENRLEVYATDGKQLPESCDGIACRDETIKLQDERIERLTSERDVLAEALEKWIAKNERLRAALEKDRRDIHTMRSALDRALTHGCALDDEIEKRDAEIARLREALAESCDENRAHVLAEGPFSTDMCAIAAKLSVEIRQLRAALKWIEREGDHLAAHIAREALQDKDHER